MKYSITSVVLTFLIISSCLITGCKKSGYQGLIYHEDKLIAETSCNEELRFYITPDTLRILSGYYYYGWNGRETYVYLNDGKYHTERKSCER